MIRTIQLSNFPGKKKLFLNQVIILYFNAYVKPVIAYAIFLPKSNSHQK